MRYCGLDNKKSSCLCINCFNTSCIAHYGKLCTLCFHKDVKDLSIFTRHEYLGYYSWTERLKGKNIPTMKETLRHKYIRSE